MKRATRKQPSPADINNPPSKKDYQRVSQEKDLLTEVAWAHGSTSATLALMQLTENQLIPYAKLPPFVVPFAGELEEGGSLGGVNQEGISGVGSDHLHYAWDYATRSMQARHETTSGELKSDLMKRLDQLLKNPEVIPTSQRVIGDVLISLQRLTLWDINALQVFLKEKGSHALIREVRVRVKARENEIADRLDLLEKLFSSRGWEKVKQCVACQLNDSPEKLLEAIYIACRQMKLFAYNSEEERASINKKAKKWACGSDGRGEASLSFKGWKMKDVVSALTRERKYFQASVIAWIYCSLKYVDEKYSPAYAHHYLTEKLQPRFQNQKKKHAEVLAFLSKGKSPYVLDEMQKMLMRKNIPLLFCSTQKHNKERKRRPDGWLWRKEGLALGKEIDVLVTDTNAHREYIERVLRKAKIANVRVGLWRPK